MHWCGRVVLSLFVAAGWLFASIGSAALAQTENKNQSRGTIGRPNIILINLDDADADLLSDKILDQHLPNFAQLARAGTRFTNCHVTTPLCGPSRTCLLRGQYAHHTGIKTNTVTGPFNNGFSGGFDRFASGGRAGDQLGGWLQAARYRTMLVGKYLHGPMNADLNVGWDDQHISFGAEYFGSSYFSTRLPDGARRLLAPKNVVRIEQETEAVLAFISEHQQQRKGQPFFLYLAPIAPHQPPSGAPMLPPKLADQGKKIRLTVTPDFNEADISDKPTILQTESMTEKEVLAQHETHRQRILSLLPVDELIQKLTEFLQQEELLDNTFIFVTSDHGYLLGHNRMFAKQLPFHRCTNVPLLVRGPSIAAGVSANQLIANIDFAPTMLALAGVAAEKMSEHKFDGLSMVPLLTAANPATEPELRSELLIENWESKGPENKFVEAVYSTLRTPSTIYTEWADGSREFYDLAVDPFQLNNQFAALDQTEQQNLRKRLHQLKTGDQPPLVTVASLGTISAHSTVAGFAEDINGVSQVLIEVQDPKSKKWLNGNEWKNNPAPLEAKLKNPNGLLTAWELSLDLSSYSSAVALRFLARSKNEAGEVSEPFESVLLIDSRCPDTELKIPENDAIVESPVMLFGFCNDNVGVAGIELTLKNTDTNQYWNGKQWVEREATFQRPLRDRLRWHVNVPMPTGNYQATAVAYDAAGNRDATPAVRTFSVK